MTVIGITEVVFDQAIYPRTEWSQATVNRYAEAVNAGDVFPPIVLEAATNRLLDGMHRWQAHKQALRNEIDVIWVQVPEGVPAKLFAASLSAKHGDRISGEELRQIAREIATDNPDYDLKTIAGYCGVTRQTVSKWVGDIVERRRHVRQIAAIILTRAGWSQKRIGEHLGCSQQTVTNDVKADISSYLTEDLNDDHTSTPTKRTLRRKATALSKKRTIVRNLYTIGRTVVIAPIPNCPINPVITWRNAR